MKKYTFADRIAAHEDLTLYFGCPDTDALYEYVHANNVTVNKPEITKYNWKALNFKDPDGIRALFPLAIAKFLIAYEIYEFLRILNVRLFLLQNLQIETLIFKH
jgi:hypothetical protein